MNGALPLIILSFDNGQALTPQREYKSWELECFLYTEDVFDAATLIDLIEDACVGYRNDGSLNLPQRLVSLRPGDHNRVASERNTNYSHRSSLRADRLLGQLERIAAMKSTNNPNDVTFSAGSAVYVGPYGTAVQELPLIGLLAADMSVNVEQTVRQKMDRFPEVVVAESDSGAERSS